MNPNNISVPFVDLKEDFGTIKAKILSDIDLIINNTRFILGETVSKFEKAFVNYIGAKYAISLNSGTTALHFALIAIGIKPNDEVITVSNSFVATSEAITYTGAKPVFVDIDPSTFNIDPEKVEKAITRRTKAIIPVHLYGQPCNLDELSEICLNNDLTLIEDACQAHGAEYKRGRIGSTGNIACFSFYPTKNLGAFGDAGILVTNEKDIAEKIEALRHHGQKEKNVHSILGYNGRMDAIQAAILSVKLPYLDKWIEQRILAANRYNELLAHNNSIELPVVVSERKHVYHLFVIRSRNRKKLQDMLTKNGIGTQIHYPIPIHLQPAFEYLGYKRNDFPQTERACEEVISLPMFPSISINQIEYVCEKINKYTQ